MSQQCQRCEVFYLRKFKKISHVTAVENKKYDLMLMKCARAYSSSCSQVVLVHVHSFCRNSLFCSRKLQKNQ